MATRIALLNRVEVRRKVAAMAQPRQKAPKVRPNRTADIRDERGLSQRALGDRIGYTQQDIQRFETQRNDWLEKLQRIAEGLGCIEQDIIGPPQRPSFFGESTGPGPSRPRLYAALLERCLQRVDDNTSERTSSARRAQLAAALYDLALHDLERDHRDAAEIDLTRYDAVFRVCADT